MDSSRTEHSRVIFVEAAAVDVSNDLIEIGQCVCLIFVLDDLYHGLSSANQLAKEICPLSIKSASVILRAVLKPFARHQPRTVEALDLVCAQLVV